MDNKTFLQLSQSARKALSQRHLLDAMDILDALMTECQDQSIYLELGGMRVTYTTILDDTAQGHIPSDQEAILLQLRRDLTLLYFRIHQAIRIQKPQDIYSNTLLKLQHQQPATLYQQWTAETDIEEKYALQDAIFCLMWTAPILGRQQADEWYSLIIRQNFLHQQYMASALMLSLLEYPDPAKMMLLIRLIDSPDDATRARALTGMLIAYIAHQDIITIFPEIDAAISDFREDPMICEEIIHLQRPLITSLRTKEIQRHIQQDILPQIKNTIHLSSQEHGIQLMLSEKAQQEAQAHQEMTEEAQQQMEQQQREMMRLAREGLDINLGTFAMLRGNDFFRTPCHWFLPLDINHPRLHPVLYDQEGKLRGLGTILLYSKQICPSDLYTFCIFLHNTTPHIQDEAMESVAEQLGLDMTEDPDDRLGQEIRYRFYVQDLYRFFHLPSMRSQFCNPFVMDLCLHDLPAVRNLYSDQQLLQDTATMLVRHHFYKPAEPILQLLLEQKENQELNLRLLVECHLQHRHWEQALPHLRKLEAIHPEETAIHQQMALCYEETGQENKLLEQLLWLEAQSPEELDTIYRSATCLLRLDKTEEALQRLHLLEYEGHTQGTYLLIQHYLHQGNGEKARKSLLRLLRDQEQLQPRTLLYAGCAEWLCHDIIQATRHLRQYFATIDASSSQSLNQAYEEYNQEMRYLQSHGIPEAEIGLMYDLARHRDKLE